ncbi:MAG: hypothetical protein ACRC9T_07670, partial [Vibrionaceae bacterium]
APEETNNSCWTTFGLIDRTSLASILYPLYQMLGLQWNNQEPDAASQAVTNKSISAHTLMLQLAFSLDNPILDGLSQDTQNIVRSLLTTFNVSSNASVRLRILLVTMHYTRSILYYRVTGDLCRILHISSKTAAAWTSNFKQRISNPGHNQEAATNPLNAAIGWLSRLPNIASLNQHNITLVPRRQLIPPSAPPTQAATATATATATGEQTQTTPVSFRGPIPHELLELLQQNRPMAQGAPCVYRHRAQQSSPRYQPYNAQAQQQRAITSQQRPLSPTLRFSPPPQGEGQLPPQQIPQAAALRFSPQPQPEERQQQLQQLLQLQQQQLQQHQQLQRQLHEELLQAAQRDNADDRQEEQ